MLNKAVARINKLWQGATRGITITTQNYGVPGMKYIYAYGVSPSAMTATVVGGSGLKWEDVLVCNQWVYEVTINHNKRDKGDYGVSCFEVG